MLACGAVPQTVLDVMVMCFLRLWDIVFIWLIWLKIRKRTFVSNACNNGFLENLVLKNKYREHEKNCKQGYQVFDISFNQTQTFTLSTSIDLELQQPP